ncbi:UNVERIFIED_CONTAM: Nuclear transcription factor Y subunit A-7 [Sesamum latifolium]|uniref:Nuclear transcription factor Y subunit n=1 Tax=Sesamum latifolium TaxID=2727402 RepID=A0AAW2XFZ0_9LAMI
MQQQSGKRGQREFDAKGYNLCLGTGSQDWHNGIRDNFMSANVLSRSTLGLNSVSQLNACWGNLAPESQVNSGRVSGMPDSVCRQEHGSLASSIVPHAMDEHLMQETQQDQSGGSNACSSYSYPDPRPRDSTLANGRPQLICPDLHGAPHCRTASSFALTSEEPVYVNAKQYHGILRRRQLRAKAELENKVTRVRKPYLHESRHLHALRRARGCGGRFINTKKSDSTAGNATHGEAKRTGDSSLSNTLCCPRGSGYASSASSGVVEPSTSIDEFKKFSLEEMKDAEFLQWTCHKDFFSE